MICAIYSRKSTAQDGNADEQSVARQIATARRFAAARGWTVGDEHVYSDSGISGAEFARRPGLVHLLAALKPRPPFDVLLIGDRDRLGREQIETSYVLKQLVMAGVRVFEVGKAGGPEITLTSPTDKVLSAVTAFAGELEREQARARTHAALEHRARAGRAVGGTCFGYTSARTAEGYVTRVIAPAEAQVLVRMFALAAEGHGVKAIARTLNADAALAPRKAGRIAGWAPASVRFALHNELYRGVAVWNRSRKRDAWGQRRKTRRDVGDHLRIDVPSLRIIDEPLWQRAHERLSAARALYFAKAGERARDGGRPVSGSAARYLLSGLATCAGCGGSMFVHRRGAHADRWGCMTRHLRGATICGNGLEVRLDDTDAAVLTAVERHLLRVDVVETAMLKAMAEVQAQDGQDGAGDALRGELARLDAEVGRLADAIARGGDLPSLVALLGEREQRRAHVRAALADHERQRVAPRDAGAVLDVMRAALVEWQATLLAETGAARAALQALIRGRFVFTPVEHDGVRGYSFEAPGTIAPVIAGIVQTVSKGISARTRTIPPALRRALQHRDQGCRFPGCGVRIGQGHHLRHWAQGGPTTLSNLAILCRRHHRAVHEEGYQVIRGPDGALHFRRPDGRSLPDVPSPPRLAGDPTTMIQERSETEGLRITARTGLPLWLGERLDLGWAIDVLHRRPRGPRPS
jgi:DNA invertase Pin-like site-specific DNA recombinase